MSYTVKSSEKFRIEAHLNTLPQFRIICVNRRFYLIQLAMRIITAGKDIVH